MAMGSKEKQTSMILSNANPHLTPRYPEKPAKAANVS